jgi:hypothetical protein
MVTAARETSAITVFAAHINAADLGHRYPEGKQQTHHAAYENRALAFRWWLFA